MNSSVSLVHAVCFFSAGILSLTVCKYLSCAWSFVPIWVQCCFYFVNVCAKWDVRTEYLKLLINAVDCRYIVVMVVLFVTFGLLLFLAINSPLKNASLFRF